MRGDNERRYNERRGYNEGDVTTRGKVASKSCNQRSFVGDLSGVEYSGTYLFRFTRICKFG